MSIFRLVSAAAGLLLIAGALLKASGRSFEPGFDSFWFENPVAQTGILQFELILGLWLLTGWLMPGALLAASGTFLCFAMVNVYQVLQGQRSCGCLGRVHIHPSITLLIDLLALAGLGLCLRDQWNRGLLSRTRLRTQGRQARAKFVAVAVGCITLFSLIGLSAIAVYGSPHKALARLRNEHIAITPSVVDAGPAGPGESRDAYIRLQNWSDHTVVFLGGSDDCACSVTKELPVEVPSGESRVIKIQIHYPPTPQHFRRTLYLITNNPQFAQVPFRMVGVCVEKEIPVETPVPPSD